MSVASEITRLQQAKEDIKTSIEGKGVTVPSATTLDGYSDLADQLLPLTVYSGPGIPSPESGNNGDIFIQTS